MAVTTKINTIFIMETVVTFMGSFTKVMFIF